MVTQNGKPEVLVLGATGQIGKLIAEHLKKNKTVLLTVTSRKPEQLQALSEEYGKAMCLDLDDPRTFADALHKRAPFTYRRTFSYTSTGELDLG